ncbi:CRISPR-associated endonuclease Cas2 [Jeotgalibaca caeni]|uniref:CRISPR-associated endonuclease Cas2 n=1 Tax=Jeotgalibaca caeni TaxID=3028623 RepID=UPI00237E2015|nr:CRISPR-associated endonuclease Cas2 [Jeotgalibaca caeni]MDE1549160.1 CRISPR-associated endonuclease Cas2 [Jeotgalibaca caeni]
MRIMVMFDLPVVTKKERKIATKFRKYLLDEGYVMMQYSVYYRICNGYDMAKKYIQILERVVPKKGSVRAFVLTEKQFSEMKLLVGDPLPIEEKVKSENLSVF